MMSTYVPEKCFGKGFCSRKNTDIIKTIEIKFTKAKAVIV